MPSPYLLAPHALSIVYAELTCLEGSGFLPLFMLWVIAFIALTFSGRGLD